MAYLSATDHPTAYATTDITSSTNVRDVSSLLDMWAHKDTPLLNRISWGPDSGGLLIEWLTEHTGFGYVQTSAAIASGTSAILITTSGTGLTTAEVAKAVQPGTVLYAKTIAATSVAYGYWVVTTINTGGGSLGLSEIAVVSASVAASAKLYIVGHFAPSGSEPAGDTSRKRAILSNKMGILRKDISITGSMMNTDMYAVPNEYSHQLAQRIAEMQFERERACCLSYGQARAASTAIGIPFGALGFLAAYIGQTWADSTTTSLTESGVNSVIRACWDNGGEPSVMLASGAKIASFTDWDRSRVRTAPDSRLGGHFVSRYMTDIGIEIELLPMRKWPENVALFLDTSKMKLRAKKNRKLLLEKLGKAGDYERWQLISEWSLEMRGYDWGYHGAYYFLT